MDVRIDLYPDAETGAYAVEVVARPVGLAAPADLPAQSADLVLDGATAKPGARSLTFTQAVPSPVVGEAFARRDRATCSGSPRAAPGNRRASARRSAMQEANTISLGSFAGLRFSAGRSALAGSVVLWVILAAVAALVLGRSLGVAVLLGLGAVL